MSDIDRLLEGYSHFRAVEYPEQHERWSELAAGQSPKTMIIACSDSRVDPSIIFNTAPGEVFVVRNVANLVPPYEPEGGQHGVSSAIEFAVTQLHVSNIVVMGHGSCGGVRAALSREFEHAKLGEGGFLANWLSLLNGARDNLCAQCATPTTTQLEHEGVKVSLANLRSFPFIREREASKELALHGMWFAIADGRLHVLDEQTGVFSPVCPTPYADISLPQAGKTSTSK